MNTKEKLTQAVKDTVIQWDEKSSSRIYADVAPADIPRAAAAILDPCGLRLITITGTDTAYGIELLYHFSDDTNGTVVSLRVLLKDRAHPSIESIAPTLKCAQWIEREIGELLGVEFLHHPCPAHLLLSDDWPEGNYPLRQGNTNERP